MYVRPKLTFVSFFYVFFLHLPLRFCHQKRNENEEKEESGLQDNEGGQELLSRQE